MEKETKKKPMAPPKRKRVSMGEYFRGIRSEVKKVVWPTRKELGAFTAVVLLTCAFFAIGFWAVDSAVLAALRAVLGITL